LLPKGPLFPNLRPAYEQSESLKRGALLDFRWKFGLVDTALPRAR